MGDRIFQIDAFTDRPFAGNPAAVCLLGGDRETTWMQALAAEMNLSETAFVRRRSDGGFELRWFTPTVEVPLCGHATLASAHALWQSGELEVDQEARFHTRSGWLEARLRDDERIELDFPAQELTPAEPPAEALAALGIDDGEAWRTGDRDGGDHDYLIELGSETAVRAVRPDLRTLAETDLSAGWIVTGPATATAVADFVSRYFAPAWGVDEDPVTGVAHCSLVPHWCRKLSAGNVVGYQASRRGGWVSGRLDGDRVFLAGHAVTVLEGRLA